MLSLRLSLPLVLFLFKIRYKFEMVKYFVEGFGNVIWECANDLSV